MRKGKLNKRSAKVDINLKQSRQTIIMCCGIFLPTKIRRQASKTPNPLGAAGTIKPKDHDKEKITNKKIMLRLLSI